MLTKLISTEMEHFTIKQSLFQMIKVMAIVFVFTLSFNAAAQSWIPFQFDSHYYISTSTITTEEPRVSFTEGEIINLISDSVSGGASFPDPMVGCDVRDKNSPCYGSLESCSDRFSWVGSPVVMETSRWLTVNRAGDTINFNKLSLADTILQRSDTLYVAHFMEFNTMTIKDQPDSIAIYSLEVRDSNGILTSNIWNGDTFILSKSFGLIQFPSWYLFPQYEAWFELFEHEITSDFSFNDVYPYQVGNVLHFRYDWENGNMPGELTFEKYVLKQCTIISVDSSEVTNRFQVQCLQETTEKHYSQDYPYGLDSSNSFISMDTIWWSSSNLALFQDNLIKETMALSLDNNNLEIHRDDTWVGMPTAQCPWEQHQFEPTYGSSTTIRLGLGEINHHSFSLSNFPFGTYSSHNRQLQYFKSQDVEYGSPSWPIGIIEKESVFVPIISPVPASRYVSINSKTPIQQVYIYNSSGVLVKQIQAIYNQSTEIQLEGLPNGVYFFRIESESDAVVQSIIKASTDR